MTIKRNFAAGSLSQASISMSSLISLANDPSFKAKFDALTSHQKIALYALTSGCALGGSVLACSYCNEDQSMNGVQTFMTALLTCAGCLTGEIIGNIMVKSDDSPEHFKAAKKLLTGSVGGTALNLLAIKLFGGNDGGE